MLLLPAHRRDRSPASSAAAEAAPEELSAHRQRHARPADAVHAPRAPRPARRHGHALLRRRRRGRTAGPGPVPGAGRPARRHGPARCPTRRCTRPRRRGSTRPRSRHTMFLDPSTARWPSTIVEQLQASDAPMRAAQLRVLGGAMARVPVDATAFAHRQQPDHGQRGRLLRGPRRPRPAPGLGRRLGGRPAARATTAPMSTSSATRGRARSARPTRARPGTAWSRSSAATTPTTCSGATRTSRRGSIQAPPRSPISRAPSPSSPAPTLEARQPWVVLRRMPRAPGSPARPRSAAWSRSRSAWPTPA